MPSSRHEFDPWVRKILCRRKWQLTQAYLAWEIPWMSGYSPWSCKGVRHDLATKEQQKWSQCECLTLSFKDISLILQMSPAALTIIPLPSEQNELPLFSVCYKWICFTNTYVVLVTGLFLYLFEPLDFVF